MPKILIVDDALFMRTMIRNALEPLGYEVVGEAENGKIGVEKYGELKPDLVTLDIVMPVEDGISALKKIKKMDPGAQVIMITAVDQRDSMLEGMHLGVADFVVKPFSEHRIVSAVEKTLGNVIN